MSTPSDPAIGRTTVTVRRAPKIQAFMAVGGLVGFLVVLIITPLFPVDPLVGLAALIGYFSLYGVTAGVLLGAIVGVVLDRRSRRRARTVEAERQVIDAAPAVSSTPEGERAD